MIANREIAWTARADAARADAEAARACARRLALEAAAAIGLVRRQAATLAEIRERAIAAAAGAKDERASLALQDIAARAQ